MVPARLRTSCSQRIFFFSFPFCLVFFFFRFSSPFSAAVTALQTANIGRIFQRRPRSALLFFPARSPLRAALLVAPWAQRHRVNGTQRFVPCSLRLPIPGRSDVRCAAFTSFPAKGDPFVPLSGGEWQREGPAPSCRITFPNGALFKLASPNSVPPAAPWGPPLQCRGARRPPPAVPEGPRCWKG